MGPDHVLWLDDLLQGAKITMYVTGDKYDGKRICGFEIADVARELEVRCFTLSTCALNYLHLVTKTDQELIVSCLARSLSYLPNVHTYIRNIT